jgi:hypothetical protein
MLRRLLNERKHRLRVENRDRLGSKRRSMLREETRALAVLA